MKFRISSIHCEYFMNFQHFEADLGHELVTFITGYEPSSEKIVLIKAIQFLLDPKLIPATAANTLKPINIPSNTPGGYVQLGLEVWDKDSVIRHLSVLRLFSNLNFVTIVENNCIFRQHIQKFQDDLTTHVSYVYPFIDLNIDQFWGAPNSLEFFKYERMNYSQQMSNAIATSLASGHQINETINSEHFENVLLSLQMLCVAERAHQMQIRFSLANTTREIFQKLTDNRYTVRFVMSAQDGLSDLVENVVCNNYTDELFTLIKADQDEILWTMASDVLKVVLRVATEIAVAQEFRVSVIFIRNIDALIRHQEIQGAVSTILNNEDEASNEICAEVNYLKNVIDVCETLKIQAIVEYSGYVNERNCNILSVDAVKPYVFNGINAMDLLKDLGYAE